MSVLLGLFSLVCLILLLAGLAKPTNLTFIFKKEVSRKKIALIFISLFILSIIIGGAINPTKENTKTV